MTIESGKSAIKRSQDIKKGVFGQERGPILIDTNLASLAFGISMEKLNSLAERYEELVISPKEDGMFEIEIRPETKNWKKDVLEEIVGYFTSQKEIGALAKRAYLKTYQALQRQATQSGFVEESDLEFCQSSLGDLWQELSPIEKKLLANQGLSPGDVYNALGIV